jgi:hypothetical protein
MAHENARFVPFEMIEEQYLAPLASREEREKKVKSHLRELEIKRFQKKGVRRLSKKERKEIKRGFLQKAKRLRIEKEQGRGKTLKRKI